ncbi:MAG: hypothetical protein MHMPM18_001785 [Marteilia pararefringens]
MVKHHDPELTKYVNKQICIKIQDRGESIEGILVGYDIFMNVSLDKCVKITSDNKRTKIGVDGKPIIIRGSSISHFTCTNSA